MATRAFSMRALLILSLAVILTACAGPAGPPGPTGPAGADGAAYVEPAYPRDTVRKLVWSGQVQCAAVVVSDRRALTAGHCAEYVDKALGAGHIPAYVDGVRVARVLYHDQLNDVAVLELDSKIAGPYATISFVMPAVDTPVVAIGYPLYGISDVYELQVATRGAYQGRLVTKGGREYIAASPNIAQGNSGGGLFVLREGKWVLIGICSAVLTHFHEKGGVAAPSHLGIYALPPKDTLGKLE